MNAFDQPPPIIVLAVPTTYTNTYTYNVFRVLGGDV